LPYDDCDIKKLAINLDKSGFVRFYSDGEKIYLNITNFVKHQNPHKNEREAGSDIPAFSDVMRQVIDLNTIAINRDKSGLIHDKDGIAHADSLIPITDSLLLIPDSSPEKSGRFIPPSSDDVFKYMQEIQKGSAIEAEKFCDFYASKGWLVGKVKMKDWRAAVRNWTKQQPATQNQRPMQVTSFQNQNYVDGDL
jgi:hypothetical protein